MTLWFTRCRSPAVGRKVLLFVILGLVAYVVMMLFSCCLWRPQPIVPEQASSQHTVVSVQNDVIISSPIGSPFSKNCSVLDNKSGKYREVKLVSLSADSVSSVQSSVT